MPHNNNNLVNRITVNVNSFNKRSKKKHNNYPRSTPNYSSTNVSNVMPAIPQYIPPALLPQQNDAKGKQIMGLLNNIEARQQQDQRYANFLNAMSNNISNPTAVNEHLLMEKRNEINNAKQAEEEYLDGVFTPYQLHQQNDSLMSIPRKPDFDEISEISNPTYNNEGFINYEKGSLQSNNSNHSQLHNQTMIDPYENGFNFDVNRPTSIVHHPITTEENYSIHKLFDDENYDVFDNPMLVASDKSENEDIVEQVPTQFRKASAKASLSEDVNQEIYNEDSDNEAVGNYNTRSNVPYDVKFVETFKNSNNDKKIEMINELHGNDKNDKKLLRKIAHELHLPTSDSGKQIKKDIMNVIKPKQPHGGARQGAGRKKRTINI